MKAINIKWETDGYDVELPNEVDIPERFINKDGVDVEAVSDWLSDGGWLHGGFEIVDECKALFNKICKPIPTYALSDEIGLDTETGYILNLETKENYVIAKEYLKSLHCSSQDIEEYIGKKIIVEFYCNGGDEWWFCNHGTIEEYFINAKTTLKRYMSNIKW